jgi:uncharacterized membrane protein YphA (DoxX/SURF4 family)
MLLTILAIVVAATFAFTGGIKLFNVPASLKVRDSLDVPPGLWRTIGVLEWLGAAGIVIGLAYRPLGLLAAIALAGLLIGAIGARHRAARRHGRSEAAGMAGDVATLALVTVTAIAFAMNL